MAFVPDGLRVHCTRSPSGTARGRLFDTTAEADGVRDRWQTRRMSEDTRTVPQHLVERWQGEEDPRPPLPMVGDERQLLTAYLDHYRETLALKCEGVPLGRLKDKNLAPSGLSLHGLLRHLAGCERWWFRIQFGEQDLPLLHYSDEDPDQDFDFEDADPAADFATWREECDRSRELVAATPDLGATGTHLATGSPVSLRRVLISMIAEYAQHCGHADLLRERLDGRTGF